MTHEYNNHAQELLDRQIKPSYHRIRIYKYLTENRNHPTVDQIFLDLQKELPTLSRATIYNTLNLFVANNLTRVVAIEDKEARYDIDVSNHGHFKCEVCGNVFDFRINIDDFKSNELLGFRIDDKNVYFKGVCLRCLQ
jgi:Fur family peroxide stress response transcriptional regulator